MRGWLRMPELLVVACIGALVAGWGLFVSLLYETGWLR